MPYLVRQQVTAQDVSGDSHNHFPGAVLSDWELSDHVRSEIEKGGHWFTQNFEPLTDREAKTYRVRATTLEGKRSAPNGQIIDPPFDDYIGLHPKDIIDRMKKMKFDDVENVRQYERAGMNREMIINYVAPSEREPFNGFNDMGVREILEKMSILDDGTNQEIIIYEMNHQKRPAVIEFEKEYEEPEVEDEKSEEPATVAV